MLEKIKSYFKKGKTQIALDLIIEYTEEQRQFLLQEDAIYNLNRLISLENRLNKGILSYQESEIIENQIRISTIKLLDELSQFEHEIEKKRTDIDFNTNRIHNITGKWFTVFKDPMLEISTKAYWILNNDGTCIYTLDDEADRTIMTVYGIWEKTNSIVLENYEGTPKVIGEVQFINENKLIHSVIDNGSSLYKNLKKIYNRI